VVIWDFLDRTFATGDRFAGAGKVIGWIVTRLFTRGYGSLDGVLKSPPLGVTQQWLKFAGAPILLVILVGLFQALKACAGNLRKIVVGHLATSPAEERLRFVGQGEHFSRTLLGWRVPLVGRGSFSSLSKDRQKCLSS
jgi:hypothetical protein